MPEDKAQLIVSMSMLFPGFTLSEIRRLTEHEVAILMRVKLHGGIKTKSFATQSEYAAWLAAKNR